MTENLTNLSKVYHNLNTIAFYTVLKVKDQTVYGRQEPAA